MGDNLNIMVLRDVKLAPNMMFNISKSRVRQSGFKMINGDEEANKSRGITRTAHKESGNTEILCTESSEGL